MPLEKKEEIGIKMYFKLIILAAALLFVSCASKSNDSEMNVWEYKKSNFQTLERIEFQDISSEIISSLKTDYKKKPKDPAYTDLQIYGAFKKSASNRTLIVFDILYVSDVMVVYELDGKGNIVERYLYSSWQ